MIRHKEQKLDEIFVGNCSISERDELMRKGVECRCGETAYDIHGKQLRLSMGIKPLFIKKSSFEKYDITMRKECGFI